MFYVQTTVQKFGISKIIFKEINSFCQQWSIKPIQSNSKDIYNVKISILK